MHEVGLDDAIPWLSLITSVLGPYAMLSAIGSVDLPNKTLLLHVGWIMMIMGYDIKI